MIGQDFELPVQITASPAESLPCLVRSLEEELQEAIQRAQVCLWLNPTTVIYSYGSKVESSIFTIVFMMFSIHRWILGSL